MKSVKPPSDQPYVTWKDGDEKGKAMAIYQASQALKRVEPIVRSKASSIYLNAAPNNVSVSDSFSRRDYEYFRPDERIPVKPKDIIKACGEVYDTVGLIRNVIDLMADFTVQGISLIHPNQQTEKFYQEWFRRVGGPERSERFCNYLYRTANVIVKRETAKLKPSEVKRVTASPDIKGLPDEQSVEKREIPWRYSFLNPLTLNLESEDLAPFIGPESFVFSLQIPPQLINKIKNARTESERVVVSKIPEAVRKLIASGSKVIVLDPEKVRSYYYKRDDWQAWAKPMTYSILSDIKLLQKMKLADLAALDGAISCIRVWKLGNIDAKIMPSETTVNRLAEMLCNNVGGGVMDLIWGPDIELMETKTDVHQFLGETKYAPVLNNIYAGLGIPPTLTGAATSGGFTNNYISLKTLTERLEYGRSILRGFWDYEIRLVQRALDIKVPATLRFDRMVLADPASEKALLIQLLDRHGISIETLQERFGECPEVEEVRVRREEKRREQGMVPPKASPFHSPTHQQDKEKLFIQSGTVTPSQVGMNLPEPKPGEETPAAHTAKFAKKKEKEKKKGVPGEGRPINSKDGKKRKKKKVVPRTAAFIRGLAVAEDLHSNLSKLVTPAFLKSVGKRNLRELTDKECVDFENFKFALLWQFKPGQVVDKASVTAAISKPLEVPVLANELLRKTIAQWAEQTGKEPTLEVLRRFQSSVYTLIHHEQEADHLNDSVSSLP